MKPRSASASGILWNVKVAWLTDLLDPLRRGHQSTGNLLIAPPRREGVRHLEPTAVISGTMMEAHAGALALVPGRILTCRGAFLLLAVGLNNVELAVFDQRPLDEIVESSLRQFPVFLTSNPSGRRSPAILKPLAVRLRVRKTNPQSLPLARPPQYDRYSLLLPDIV